ncbi:MAG: nitrogenase component 1 [Lachnospiraceae bacterium]|nr:nitrogenase component 1 [Lachnospiraceae bacterium]
MSLMEERKVLTRERRLQTLSHYNGALEGLRDETNGAQILQRVRTLTQVSPDEILYALRILSTIKDTAVVVHGAAGCAASGLGYHEEQPFRWYSTNLDERDTILGGDEKLRSACLRASRETHAKVIFIVGTPVIAINNDDVQSLILELSEETDSELIFVYTDGFKTKTPLTGYDIVSHVLLKYVVGRAGARVDGEIASGAGADANLLPVNLLSFSENPESLAAIVSIFRELCIPFRLLPRYASVETIQQAGNALASVALNPEEGQYLSDGLEECFQVPGLHLNPPVGLKNVRSFILRIAELYGCSSAAEEYVERQESMLDRELGGISLAGKRFFLDAPLPLLPGLLETIRHFGGEVVGLSVLSVDTESRGYLEKLPSLNPGTAVVVANGQPFEKANVIAKRKADYYLSYGGEVAFAGEIPGCIPVSLAHTAILGYEGIRQLIGRIRDAVPWPLESPELYKKSWLRKSANWYVKQEVK